MASSDRELEAGGGRGGILHREQEKKKSQTLSWGNGPEGGAVQEVGGTGPVDF